MSDVDPIGAPESAARGGTIAARILDELLAVDRGVNAVMGGDIDQTISARAYAVELAGVSSFWRKTIDRLFYEGHCREAWEGEMERLVP